MLYKQPTLKKLWNYNNFVQILYSYSCFRYTSRLFRGCAFFCYLLLILSGLREKPRKNKDWVTEKYIEEFKWGETLFWLHTFLLSMSLFVAFFIYSLSIQKWRTCWMDPEWTLLSHKSMIYFRLCFSFICSGYDLILIKNSAH